MLISPPLGMTSSTLLITNLMVKRSTARMENTLGHFHKNTESPAVATVLCAHLLLHLNGELIHFQQFVVEAFLKKSHLSVNSVVKFHHLIWISSSCCFCQTCNLYIQTYLKQTQRCTKHTATTLLREFQLLLEPPVFYTENLALLREREWTNEEIIHPKMKIDSLSTEGKGWRVNKMLLLFTQR